MTIGEAGEFALIDAVTAMLPTGVQVLVGPGDDAAVVAAPDQRVVVTTDMLVENVHFRRDWSSAYDVGRKAAAQNLADVVAMGARPTALFVAFAAPADLLVAWATDFARGMADECGIVGAAVAGGDMARSATVVVSVTALGDLQGRSPVLRRGARAGDVIFLVGETGASAAGLALLGADRPELVEEFADLVALHRAPCPAYTNALALAVLGATAMIDVSDGLSSELHHVARASGVGLAIDGIAPSARLSAAANALGVDARDWVLHGGEDHAFLATVPPARAAAADALATRIGVVVEGSGVTVAGQPLAAAGWDHFGGPA